MLSTAASTKEMQPCIVSTLVVNIAFIVLFDIIVGNVIEPDKLVEVKLLSITLSI